MYKVCSETGISIRVPLRTWKVGRLSGSVRDERVLWTRSFLSNGFARVKPGGGTLPGTLKFMSRKDLQTGSCLHWGPFGKIEGVRLTGTLRGERRSLETEVFYLSKLRDRGLLGWDPLLVTLKDIETKEWRGVGVSVGAPFVSWKDARLPET
jgi:hypothetical protein